MVAAHNFVDLMNWSNGGKMKRCIIIGLTSIQMSGLMISISLAEGVRLFAHHTVADFNIWKKGYDSYAKEQKRAGVIKKSVYRSVDNPNEVTVIHDFKDLNSAKVFANSPELAALMAKIGVQGRPEIWITKVAEKR